MVYSLNRTSDNLISFPELGRDNSIAYTIYVYETEKTVLSNLDDFSSAPQIDASRVRSAAYD